MSISCIDQQTSQFQILLRIQGELAARNIIRLIKRAEGASDEPLERYKPAAPAIKVSLGLVRSFPSCL